MVTLGVGCVPQLITRGEIRKMHGMQVNYVSCLFQPLLLA